MHQQIDLQPILNLAEDDPEFCQELLGQYHRSFLVFPAEFEQALQTGDLEQVRLLVHKVKASVRMAGMDDLDRLLHRATLALPPQGELADTLQQVQQHCQALVAAIEQEISR